MIIVCYYSIKGRKRYARCVSIQKVDYGDFECRDERGRLVATFHHDQLHTVKMSRRRT